MGGSLDIVNLMVDLGKPVPKVYKYIDNNESEIETLDDTPEVE